MTTPNSLTNGSVTTFNWKRFPLEEESFVVCLIKDPVSFLKESPDFSNLTEYIRIVFPEHKTQFHELSQKDTSIWLTNHNLISNVLKKSHIIVTGEYKNIPPTILTNSRILIFESQDDTNKYLQNRHGASLNNFNIDSNFIVVDKSIMGHFSIYGMIKKDLIRYDKALRLSQ